MIRPLGVQNWAAKVGWVKWLLGARALRAKASWLMTVCRMQWPLAYGLAVMADVCGRWLEWAGDVEARARATMGEGRK